jgi:uncharacterized membrane protein YozB (DUF420 family)
MSENVIHHAATGHSACHGAHVPDHDVPKAENLGIWMGLVAFTFFYGTFIATNVYLRGWSPTKFVLDQHKISNIPYYSIFDLIALFIVLIIAGSLFKAKKWKALNGVMALTGLLFVLYTLFQFWIIQMYGAMSPQIWTAYMPAGVLQLILAVASLIYISWVGWRSTFKNKAPLQRIFTLGMNIWLYTVITSVATYLLTDVMTVGSIAQWCGIK